jgi:hypothetical protein
MPVIKKLLGQEELHLSLIVPDILSSKMFFRLILLKRLWNVKVLMFVQGNIGDFKALAST